MKWIPRPYQKKALKVVLGNAAQGLLLDLSLGKTAVSLTAFHILKNEGVVRGALVIAPKRPCQKTWPDEIEKWDHLKGMEYTYLHGLKKDKLLDKPADIFLINPEGLLWLMDPDDRGRRMRKLLEYVDVLIVDESSKFKSTKSTRYKLLKKWIPYFRRRYILTGTPAPNGLLDLFPQIYILDQGAALGEYITKFRKAFFTPTGFGGHTWLLQEPAAETEERIYEKLRPLVLRMDAADYLDLPEQMTNRITVELPQKVKLEYARLEVALVAYFGKKKQSINASSASSAGMMLRQLVNGAIYKDLPEGQAAKTKKDRWVEVHQEKLEATIDLVDELGGRPLFLLYEFQHDHDRLMKALKPFGIESAMNAKTTKAFSDLIDRWNEGRVPVLLAHPQSMGHGLNMQGEAQHVAWFGLPWDLEVYMQANGRVRRFGNKHKHVFIHHLIAEGTIEERVADVLADKAATQQRLLDALKDPSLRRR